MRGEANFTMDDTCMMPWPGYLNSVICGQKHKVLVVVFLVRTRGTL